MTVARHPDVLQRLRASLGLNAAAISAGPFERIRASDRGIIGLDQYSRPLGIPGRQGHQPLSEAAVAYHLTDKAKGETKRA